MEQALFLIQQKLVAYLNGYINTPEIEDIQGMLFLEVARETRAFGARSWTRALGVINWRRAPVV